VSAFCWLGSSPFDDGGYGVFAQPDFAPNEAIASALGDQGHHLGREAVGLRPLPELASEPFTSCLRGGDTGADSFRRQFAFELGDAGQHGGHHAPVRRRQIKRHSVECDQGDASVVI
jgi:hypothetical protein